MDAEIGECVTLSCKVIRATKKQWYKEENDCFNKLNGAIEEQYTFNNIQKSDGGKYYFEASIDGENCIESRTVTIKFKGKYKHNLIIKHCIIKYFRLS